MNKVRLIDICQPKQWKTIPTSQLTKEGYPVYGANGKIGFYSEYNHEKETILITCRGATCGSLNISEPFSYVNGNAMCLDNLDDRVSLKYLYYNLCGYNFAKVISGTAQPQITGEGLSKVYLTIHDTNEQQRIVSVFDKLERIILSHKQYIQKLDELIKSRFVEMFGRMKNNQRFPYFPLGDFTQVMSGGTPDRENTSYWLNGYIPWIKTTELHNTLINDSEEYITDLGLDESSAKMVPPQTILIAMYGQGRTRGMTGMLNIEACTNQACACILPSENINQFYLWRYLILSYDNLRSLAKGGNQPNLNAGIIKSYPILMPPIELQNQFANFVTQVEKQKATVQQSIDKLETLKKSLMQEYFG